MKKDDRISIFLSPGELYCIAGSLGYPTLPLLNSYFQKIPVEELKLMLLEGLESLKNRSLIWDEGGKTMTDLTLRNLVEVIARPQYTLGILNISRADPPSHSFIFFKSGQSLAVTQKGRYFNLSLFRDRVALKRTLDSWVGLGTQVSDKAKMIHLPSMETAIKMMTMIWKEPNKVAQMFEAAGHNEKEVDELIKVLTPCTFFSSLTRLNWDDNISTQVSRLLVFGNATTLWAQEVNQNNAILPDFKPFHVSDLSVMLRKYTNLEFNEPVNTADTQEI